MHGWRRAIAEMDDVVAFGSEPCSVGGGDRPFNPKLGAIVKKGIISMRKVMALLVTLAMLMLSAGATVAQTMPSQAPVDPIEGCNYYEETGHNLCDTFLAYWESNGGLPVFGYPITEEYQEENWDTGETYTVQYFERERFEYHPENAGTVYEVLLGRLGNEVLLMQGRNWHAFEKSDPSEPNYMEATGFAVAPEFIGYWSSHGLDFDEPGSRSASRWHSLATRSHKPRWRPTPMMAPCSPNGSNARVSSSTRTTRLTAKCCSACLALRFWMMNQHVR